MARRPDSFLPPDPDLLKELRGKIAAIERAPPVGQADIGAQAGASAHGGVFELGDAAIDRMLPWNGLPRGAVHEIEPGDPRDHAAVSGFCAALVTRLLARRPERPEQGDNGMVLWCLRRDGLYDAGVPHGAGLAAFGLDPERLMVVCGARDADVLWAMEEGLACRRLQAVIGEVKGGGLAASRRLSLAARSNGVAAFLLRPSGARAKPRSSAALTRWRITTAPAAPRGDGEPSSGPRWRVELTRCRNGPARDWLMEWDYETRRLSVVAPVADRPAVPCAPAGQNTAAA